MIEPLRAFPARPLGPSNWAVDAPSRMSDQRQALRTASDLGRLVLRLALELQAFYLFTALAIALLGAGRFSLGGKNGAFN